MPSLDDSLLQHSSSTTTSFVIILLFFGIILGTALHSADAISGPEVASIWTSVVLTLFLAYISSKQNDILEMQSRIMGGRHTPILSASKLSFTDQEPNSGNALQISNGGEFLSFSVKNEGNDIAAGLSILYIPTFVSHGNTVTIDETEDHEEVTIDQTLLDEETLPFVDQSVPPHLAREFPVYSTNTTTEASDIEGATVPTGTGTNEMYAQAGFYVLEDNQKKPIGFARGIQRLLNQDPIKAVIVGRILTYQNPFEESSHLILPALRFNESLLDSISEEPFDTVIKNKTMYSNSEYRDQMRKCAEAHLEDDDIIYFEAK